MIGHSAGQAHENGDCWPSQCPACQAEDDRATVFSEVYGLCTLCGALESNLVKQTGTRDFSDIGESATYPTGYGCEVCS